MLPEGSPIKILHLPYGVKNIELVNQIKLTDLTIEGYENIETIVWENTPKTTLKAEEILNKVYSVSGNKLNTLRLIDYYPVESVTTSYMNWFMGKSGYNDIGGGIAAPYVTGKMSIKTTDINTLEFKSYMTQFINQLGTQFVYASVTNNETLETTYYTYNVDKDIYEAIDDTSFYKLELHLDQIVEDEYIFGVIGEGE